jgi:putrescine transport system ATP-binding protein
MDGTSPPTGSAASKAQAIVSIETVTKRFGEFTAVDSVSLDIVKGEMFALLGGSGCGKTTLLRMLAGFEEPSAGRILIDGADMAGIPPYERPVNMMFQSYALFPHMSVAANVGYGLKNEALTTAQRQDRVREMLELVQLTQFAERKPHQLSGGQRQRVALARALAKQPKLLLLDEPLGALDKKLREQTQFEIANIQYKTGITFIVVTHDQEEAMTLANRIAVMDKGVIRQVGTPTEIYEFPRSRFVADFIGSVNMFPAKLESHAKGSAVCHVPGLAQKLSAAAPVRPGKQDVSIAFRPEKVMITRTRPKKSVNVLTGVVQDLGYFGKDSLYRIKLDCGAVISVNSVNSRRADESERVAQWEDRVWLTIDPSAVLVLEE